MSIKLIAKKSLHQRIALTPALKKSIDILQLSKYELLERISDICQENPFLNKSDGEDFVGDFLNEVPESLSLQDSILLQIPDIIKDLTYQGIAKNLTYCLDENGLIDLESINKISTDLKLSTRIIYDEIIEILQKNIEPAGVFARNNRESIYLQCQKRRMPKNVLDLVHHLLFDYGSMEYKKTLEIVLKKFPHDIIEKAMNEIAKCDLSPGLNFKSTQTIRPDLKINTSKDGGISVIFIKDDLPDILFDEKLSKDFQYADKTNKKVKSLIDQAKWFISAIDNRNKTLEKVGVYMCLFQKEFISGNRIEPKPLTNIEIAKELNVSPSTISRVIREKFILVDGKNVSLKKLLIPSVSKTKKMTPNDFIQEISQIINTSKDALSDQKITNLLNIRGFNIARRTVAKYRKISGLDNSRKRKAIV